MAQLPRLYWFSISFFHMTNPLKEDLQTEFKSPFGDGIEGRFECARTCPTRVWEFRQGFRVIAHSKEPDGGVIGGVNLLLDLIEKHPGRKVPFLVAHNSIPERTIRRRITELKPDRIQGSPEDRRILDQRLKCLLNILNQVISEQRVCPG